MLRRHFIGWGALLALIVGGWIADRATVSTPRTRVGAAERPTAMAPGHVANTAVATSEDIRRVLPSVTEPVRDWSQFKPAAITVAPYPGLGLTFHAVRISEENGITTWVGRNGLPGASLVGIGKRDSWYGVLSMIGGSYDIEVFDSQVRVVEHTGPLNCGVTVLSAHDHPLGQDGASKLALVRSPDANAHAAIIPVGDPSVHTSGTTVYTVDIAYFYSPETRDALAAGWNAGGDIYGPKDGMPAEKVQSYLDSKLRAYSETHDLIIEQSQIADLHWRFVGVFLTPAYTPKIYDHNGPNSSARYDMGFDSTISDDPSSPVGEFVAQKMANLAADDAVFLVPNNRQFGGLADYGGNQCVVDVAGDVYSSAHELGHTFGLSHDRATDGAHDGDGHYNYGYTFNYNPGQFGGLPYDYEVGDVMSYATVMPYFSNPNIALIGNSLGLGSVTDTNAYPLGVPIEQPKAAYAARWLSERAAAKAAYRNPAGETFPAISVQPLSTATSTTGGTVRLGVSASGTHLTYQWRKNLVAISGATSSTLTLANVQSTDAGNYDVMVSNVLGTVISSGTTVAPTTGVANAKLINISTRSSVGTGDSVQIAGFVISGSPKTVLIRASGPALGKLGVGGALADPMLELHDGAGVIGSNDDWSSDPAKAALIQATAQSVGAFGWDSGSKDAAILTTLNPGTYSAIVSGKNGGTGVALIEVYEVSGAGSNVVNISTRSPVGTGDAVQIAGFVVGGNGPKTVLIRASGPAFGNLGVSGTLVDPVLELHDNKAVVGCNDDWSSNPTDTAAIQAAAKSVGAFDWATGSKDAALLMTLAPGTYTAIVSSKTGNPGVALIEVYDVSR